MCAVYAYECTRGNVFDELNVDVCCALCAERNVCKCALYTCALCMTYMFPKIQTEIGLPTLPNVLQQCMQRCGIGEC